MTKIEKGFTWDNYRKLLQSFLDRDYEFCGYTELDPKASHVILRHDIDFSLKAALDIASIEAEEGVSAHYYVLLRTEFYNLCSPTDWDIIKEIQQLGHDVGLHFDGSQYSDDLEVLETAVSRECDILEKIVEAPVTSISFHRPAQSLQGLDRRLAGRSHTYQPQYFSKIAYISDSQGVFRFGHPLDSDAFEKRSAMQLLTHPIWWTPETVSDKIALIDQFLVSWANLLRAEAVANCKPYAARLSGLVSPNSY